MPPLLPVALNVAHRKVLVVGGGNVAARKANLFLECGANVTGLAPEFGDQWPQTALRVERAYQTGDCVGFAVVLAATDNPGVNEQVRAEAAALGLWCNDASAPESSDFTTVAVLRRGVIQVGIGTGGTSPVLARHVRQILEAALGTEYESLLELAAAWEPPLARRGEFWRQILASDALVLLRAGETDAARNVIHSIGESFQV